MKESNERGMQGIEVRNKNNRDIIKCFGQKNRKKWQKERRVKLERKKTRRRKKS